VQAGGVIPTKTTVNHFHQGMSATVSVQ
jgi:hypothetical protein